MKIKIGPAGLGGVKTAENTLEEYAKKGFKACEVAFTYGVYIKNKDDAIRIGKKAEELGISLSIHASYFVNLNSSDLRKREATKKRILACCEVGEWLGAKRVVFHPGYYGKSSKEETYEIIKKGILEMMTEIKKKGWKIKIAPETMGKVNVFGSVNEISSLVKDTGCGFCIDFAHILAREKKVDYEKLSRLFPQEEWHCHFSGIVYGEKGERNHKKTEKEDWKELFENLNKIAKKKDITLVNESPAMLEDCEVGLRLAGKILK